MKMDGEKIINASKQEVWDALNNPEKLKLAIPGAENVEKKDENNLTATVKTKIGPISAKFTGNITLFDGDTFNTSSSIGSTQKGTNCLRLSVSANSSVANGHGATLHVENSSSFVEFASEL